MVGSHAERDGVVEGAQQAAVACPDVDMDIVRPWRAKGLWMLAKLRASR